MRRTRGEMHRKIDGDYYGLRDEEDGLLVKVEAAAEAKLRRQAVEEWEEREAERQASLASVRGGMADVGAAEAAAEDAGPGFVAYVPLPDQKEIEAKILESKKHQLIKQYASEGLLKEQQEAKEMLNRR